jgi:hypothetical protein
MLKNKYQPFKHELHHSVLSAVTPFYIGNDGILWLQVKNTNQLLAAI